MKAVREPATLVDAHVPEEVVVAGPKEWGESHVPLRVVRGAHEGRRPPIRVVVASAARLGHRALDRVRPLALGAVPGVQRARELDRRVAERPRAVRHVERDVRREPGVDVRVRVRIRVRIRVRVGVGVRVGIGVGVGIRIGVGIGIRVRVGIGFAAAAAAAVVAVLAAPARGAPRTERESQTPCPERHWRCLLGGQNSRRRAERQLRRVRLATKPPR